MRFSHTKIIPEKKLVVLWVHQAQQMYVNIQRVYQEFSLKLGKNSQINSFMSLLTTCNMSNIFSGAWFQSQADIGLSLKSNNHSQVKFVRIPSTQGLKEDYIIEKCFCFVIDLKETLNDWKVSTLIRSSHVFALGPSNCCDDEKVERWKVTNTIFKIFLSRGLLR